jgi:hypothetical protein
MAAAIIFVENGESAPVKCAGVVVFGIPKIVNRHPLSPPISEEIV